MTNDDDEAIVGPGDAQRGALGLLFYYAHPIERLFWLVLAVAIFGLIATIILYAGAS